MTIKNSPTIESFASHLWATRLLVLFTFFIGFSFLPQHAYALDPLSSTVCTVVNWFTGNLGRAIATLGIAVLGIGALLGKTSWQVALTVSLGISIMFGGAQLLDALVSLPIDGGAQGLCAAAGGELGGGQLTEAVCKLSQMVTGDTGKAFGTLGVVLLGVGALMGKVSPGVALMTAIGIALISQPEAIMGVLASEGEGGASVPRCVATSSGGGLIGGGVGGGGDPCEGLPDHLCGPGPDGPDLPSVPGF